MKNFPKGLYAKAPHERAPDFVKAKVSVKIAEFQEFLSGQQGEWLNIDIKQSKDGKFYAEIDDWKPSQHEKKKADGYATDKQEFVDWDIPF